MMSVFRPVSETNHLENGNKKNHTNIALTNASFDTITLIQNGKQLYYSQVQSFLK